MTNVIEYSNIDIKISDRKIITNTNFTLKETEFVFLNGKIGAGKSTLLRSFYADLDVTGNSANVLDFDLLNIRKKEIPFLRRKIGIIFQKYKFLPDKNIKENLAFVLEATGWGDEKKIDERIKEVLAEVEMDSKLLAMPYELSGGEQQRISFARAVLNFPKIILADEPTANLDEETAFFITKKLLDLTQKGASVIFVTHNNNIIKKYNNVKIWNIENKKLSEI